MSILKKWIQQPSDRIDYAFDYANGEDPFLEPGDSLESATVVCEPTGLHVHNVSAIEGQVRFWVTGGIPGEKYKVTCTASTKLGRIKQDEVIFVIKEY